MIKAMRMTSACISHPNHSSTPILPAFLVHTHMYVCMYVRERDRGRDREMVAGEEGYCI